MDCCKTNCIFASVIASLIVGVVLGVLYSLGFVATGIIFWVFLAIGAGAALLLPIYAFLGGCQDRNNCVCRHRGLLAFAAIGTIIVAAVGLIVPITSTIVTAIVVGVATFFAALLLSSAICFARCLNDC